MCYLFLKLIKYYGGIARVIVNFSLIFNKRYTYTVLLLQIELVSQISLIRFLIYFTENGFVTKQIN